MIKLKMSSLFTIGEEDVKILHDVIRGNIITKDMKFKDIIKSDYTDARYGDLKVKIDLNFTRDPIVSYTWSHYPSGIIRCFCESGSKYITIFKFELNVVPGCCGLCLIREASCFSEVETNERGFCNKSVSMMYDVAEQVAYFANYSVIMETTYERNAKYLMEERKWDGYKFSNVRNCNKLIYVLHKYLL